MKRLTSELEIANGISICMFGCIKSIAFQWVIFHICEARPFNLDLGQETTYEWEVQGYHPFTWGKGFVVDVPKL